MTRRPKIHKAIMTQPFGDLVPLCGKAKRAAMRYHWRFVTCGHCLKTKQEGPAKI